MLDELNAFMRALKVRFGISECVMSLTITREAARLTGLPSLEQDWGETVLYCAMGPVRLINGGSRQDVLPDVVELI